MNNLSKHRCETCDKGFADADVAFEHARVYGHGITVQAQVHGDELLAKAIAAQDVKTPAHDRRQKISIMQATGISGTLIGPHRAFVNTETGEPCCNNTEHVAAAQKAYATARAVKAQGGSAVVGIAGQPLAGGQSVELVGTDGFIFTAGADDETKAAFRKLYNERKAAFELSAVHEAQVTADREISQLIARRVADSGMPTGSIGCVYQLARAAVAWALADARADRLSDELNVAQHAHEADPTAGSSARCDSATDALTKACHEESLRDAEMKRLAKALVVELDR